MSGEIAISEAETGAVRVFAIPDAETMARLKAAAERHDAAPLAEVLGATAVDLEYVDVIGKSDLGPLSLSEYLAEGVGIAPDEFKSDRARLDGLVGAVIVLSRAVAGRTATLNPKLDLVATLHEDRAPVHFEPLPDAGAKGTLAAPPETRPDRQGKRAPIGLIVGGALLIAAVLFLLLWPRP